MFDSLSPDELEFVQAIEKFKAKTGKLFLSWTEVLGILTDLGYKKVPPPRKAAPPTPREVDIQQPCVEQP